LTKFIIENIKEKYGKNSQEIFKIHLATMINYAINYRCDENEYKYVENEDF
jgi:hypothetical protein